MNYLKSIFSAVILFWGMNCISAGTPKDCLAPASEFKNNYDIVDFNITPEKVSELKEKTEGSKGSIQFFYFDGSAADLKLSETRTLSVSDQEELMLRALKQNEGLPCFAVFKSKVDELQKFLSENFVRRDFVLILLQDDPYDTIPLVEYKDRFNDHPEYHWDELNKVFRKMGIRKISYMGESAIRHLSGQQISSSYSVEKSSLPFMDLLTLYGDLSPENEALFRQKGKTEVLIKRKDLSDSLIEYVFSLQQYHLALRMFREHDFEEERILKLFEKQMLNYSGRTFSGIIANLIKEKGKNSGAACELFYQYCLHLEDFNKKEQYPNLDFTLALEWNVDLLTQAYYIEELDRRGFNAWESIFTQNSARSSSFNKLIKHLAQKNQKLTGKILSALAGADHSFVLTLWDLISGDTSLHHEEILMELLPEKENRKELESIAANADIPFFVRGLVLLEALSNSSLSEENYEQDFRSLLETPRFYDFMKRHPDPEEDAGLKAWYRMAVMFPGTVKDFLVEMINLPEGFKERPYDFAVESRNRDFLLKYANLMDSIRHKGFFKEKLTSVSFRTTFFSMMNNLLTHPSAERLNIFNSLESFFQKISISLKELIEKYPHIPSGVLLFLAAPEEEALASQAEAIFQWNEFQNNVQNKLRFSGFWFNPNLAAFREHLKLMFQEFLRQGDSKTNRNSFVKTVEYLNLFLNLPQNDVEKTFKDGMVQLLKDYALSDGNETFGKNVSRGLELLFVKTLKDLWEIPLREDLKPEVLQKRLLQIQDFWIYYVQWTNGLSMGKVEDQDLKKTLDLLKTAVIQFLNEGKDIKDMKYGGTKESQKQVEIMEKLLSETYSPDLVKNFSKHYREDTHETVRLPGGKMLYAYSDDSLEFWLKRGYFGGGTCASPRSDMVFTKCVNGVTFSAMSKRIIVSTTAYGKEGIVSESRSITDIQGHQVPILLNEHFYMADNLPQGFSRGDYSRAAVINSIRSAARYGMDHVFFVTEGTKEPSGFYDLSEFNGYTTTLEWIDESGMLVQEEIRATVKESSQERTFYVLEEASRWKYSDNSLYMISKEGGMDKTYKEANIIDFGWDAYEGQIAGIPARYVRNVLKGDMFVLERKEISRKPCDIAGRLARMYPELNPDEQQEKAKALTAAIQEKRLKVVGDLTLAGERQRNTASTLMLINEVSDLDMAADKFLSHVYRITQRLSDFLMDDLEKELEDPGIRKFILGIPRGGIPIASKMKKVFKKAGLPKVSVKTVDVDRKILDSEQHDAADLLVVCDQVINTGKTISRTLDYYLSQNPDLKFIITAISADPNAVLRLYRKYPQIKCIYTGDLKRRVEVKEGVRSALGHPGERSYGKEYGDLFIKGADLTLRNMVYRMEGPLDADRHFKSFLVTQKDTGRQYRLKIMVGEEEGLINASASALAREENFRGGILQNVQFYPEEGMLLSEYIEESNLLSCLEQKEKKAGSSFVQDLIQDVLEASLFLKQQGRPYAPVRPQNLLYSDDYQQWYFASVYDSGFTFEVSDTALIGQIRELLFFLSEYDKANGYPFQHAPAEFLRKMAESSPHLLEDLVHGLQKPYHSNPALLENFSRAA